MIASSEMALRILAELEEAQQDTITAVLNTVITPANELWEPLVYREACLDLVTNGLVRVSVSRGADGRKLDETQQTSVILVKSLIESFTFSVLQKHWALSASADSEYDFKTFPNLVLTEAGLVQAVSILDQRGYRWWTVKR